MTEPTRPAARAARPFDEAIGRAVEKITQNVAERLKPLEDRIKELERVNLELEAWKRRMEKTLQEGGHDPSQLISPGEPSGPQVRFDHLALARRIFASRNVQPLVGQDPLEAYRLTATMLDTSVETSGGDITEDEASVTATAAMAFVSVLVFMQAALDSEGDFSDDVRQLKEFIRQNLPGGDQLSAKDLDEIFNQAEQEVHFAKGAGA